MLTDLHTYSHFVYTLLADRSGIVRHTVAVYSIGAELGQLRGEIDFGDGYILRVFERVDFHRHKLLAYFYELARGSERLWWYDPMPHYDDASLQSTHPHHKHIQPDIKHNRVPAPGLSFTQANLPFLIKEVEQELYMS